MAQSARLVPPDLANSGWSPPAGGTGIAAAISISNNPNPPAPQIVTSTPDPAGAIFTVKLNPLSWPQNGDQVLRVLMNRIGPGAFLLRSRCFKAQHRSLPRRTRRRPIQPFTKP